MLDSDPVPDEVLVKFGALHMEPGDILVMMVKDEVSEEWVAQTEAVLKPLLPEGVEILVLQNGITLGRITRRPA